ncbi:MAG: MBL fold metallo-hydrolase [Proteobacteria bacterium]|nr:MBL fold metallo-hydrolase [Pseudomonadota bacterium]
MKKIFISFILLCCVVSIAFGQANGNLQLHFIDVGQGDAAILISPEGETVLFDNGVAKYCDMPVSYLRELGITKMDYHVASHYHDDHIGCTSEVLDVFPLKIAAYDRGHTYATNVFRRYEKIIGVKGRTAIPGDTITMDSTTTDPVTIKLVVSNGDGINTTNENDLSLVSVISFGKFDVLMGGDLSGFNTDNYKDIESSVASKVGQVEVYKVHHHCSNYSTNDKLLSIIKPKIGIISASGIIGRNHSLSSSCR